MRHDASPAEPAIFLEEQAAAPSRETTCLPRSRSSTGLSH
jgi:hypothetical protein